MPVAIPALAVVCVALLAVALCWAAKQFGQAVANVIPKDLPIIHATLHNAVQFFADAAAAILHAIMADLIRPAVNLVTGPVVNVITWIDKGVHVAYETAATLGHLITWTIPQALHRIEVEVNGLQRALLAYVAARVHELRSLVRGWIHDARVYAAALVAAAVHQLAADIHAVRTLARTLVADARHALAADIAGVRTLARTLVGDLEAKVARELGRLEREIGHAGNATRAWVLGQVARGVAAAEADTAKAVRGAISTVESTAVQTLPKAWAGISDEVKALDQALGTSLPAIRTAVDDIPLAVPTDIAAALAGVTSLAIPALRYLTKCGVPNCRNLSAFGRDLQALLGAVEGAGFVALLVWMLNNRDEAAHDAVSVLGAIVDDTASAARDLLGV